MATLEVTQQEWVDQYANKMMKSSCFKARLVKIDVISQLPKPDMYNTHFFPSEVKTFEFSIAGELVVVTARTKQEARCRLDAALYKQYASRLPTSKVLSVIG